MIWLAGAGVGAAHSRLVSLEGGVSGALAALVAIVHGAMADGTWVRLKVCQSDRCRFAFYDSSRNRSGTWCSMQVCGNRAKVRTYRQRRTSGGAPAN
ncbi:MAG: CGNR zinc finger domain-containing protein [Acidimicrobiales bacterium]